MVFFDRHTHGAFGIRLNEAKKFRRKLEKSAKFFCLKIGRNENFIMQMAYGDKKIFYNFFLFIIEKFDFLVEMPPEREVL